MLSLENRKGKLAYAGFASFFAGLYVIIGMMVSDVAAQRDKYDKIECTRLKVVNAKGDQLVNLGQTEGGGTGIWIYGTQERKRGWFGGKGNHHLVTLQDSENGGIIVVRENFVDKDYTHYAGALIVSEYGGGVLLDGKIGGDVFMYIDEYGNGAIDK